MKISRNTQDQLIIENQPWLVAVILGVMMLVFFGVGLSILMAGDRVVGLILALGTPLFFGLFFWAFVRRNQLVLDAMEDRVTHSRRTLTGYTRQTFELGHLSHASVQTSNSGDSPTHRMALHISGGMDAGIHPFTTVYTSGTGADRAADAVNAWLAGRNG